ncbi:MAG: hypothetical protein KJO23_02850 [Bacteroidia bacterium]|nr:hypothetical protein [Bacteroidia bacterium]
MDKLQQDIERYLHGKMGGEELLAFDLRLQKDKELANLLQEEQLARKVIREAGRLELKETLQEFENEMPARNMRPRVIPLWIKRAFPVAAMVIIFFGLYQVFKQNTMTPEVAFDTYFESYAAPSVLRDNEGSAMMNWKQATQLFSDGDYQEAAIYFDRSVGEVPSYQAEFYKGLSQLSMEAPYFQRAVNSFDRVLETDNDFVQQARWYKALALIGMNKQSEAQPLLKEIVANEAYNHQQAAELLTINWKR